MFFKKNPHSPPVVREKKASEIIKASSHKQKMYHTLMLVPSYTTGRTRSLRIHRSVFYCVLISLFVVSAVIMGLQIRANYFNRIAQDYSTRLAITMEEFDDFKYDSMEELNKWIADHGDAIDDLEAERFRARWQENNLMRDHQGALNDVQNYLDELERQINEFEEKLAAAIEGLSSRAIIPPIANLLEQLENSQAQIRETFLFSTPGYTNGYTNGIASAIPVSFSENGIVPLHGYALTLPPETTEEDLHDQIQYLLHTLDMLTELAEDLQTHRELIDPYERNFPTLWPIPRAISSGFGNRRCPFGGGGWVWHAGIDISAPTGTPIRAAGGGTVITSGWVSGGYGNVVVIDHGFGLRTKYAHNSANLVTVGQRVERGDIIARVGTTGLTTGPHVHFEVHRNGVPINPRPFLIE
jgi:murein DD-endopeptidase MepM/ murein hydrolase activator NlpD